MNRRKFLASTSAAAALAPQTVRSAAAAPKPVLMKLGCQFSLDDFGAGFSSFLHLKHLPVDFLKIDGSFIKDLALSEVDQHLVRAMVDVARGLGKQTVAEFVGDQATVRMLSELGVDFAQGYYIGRPRELHRALLESAITRAA